MPKNAQMIRLNGHQCFDRRALGLVIGFHVQCDVNAIFTVQYLTFPTRLSGVGRQKSIETWLKKRRHNPVERQLV